MLLCEANDEEETAFVAKSSEMQEKALSLGAVVGRYGSAVASYEPIVETEEKEIKDNVEFQMLMRLQKWHMGRGLI